MSDAPNEQDAAKEAAQNVVDEVTSREYSAEPDTIGSKLADGLEEARVDLDDEERRRIVEEIDDVKQDESRGAPDVTSAQPADDPTGP